MQGRRDGLESFGGLQEEEMKVMAQGLQEWQGELFPNFGFLACFWAFGLDLSSRVSIGGVWLFGIRALLFPCLAIFV